MRNLVIIIILVLFYAGCINEKSLDSSLKYSVSDSLPDTSGLENVFGCVFEIDDEPLPNWEAWTNFLKYSLELDSVAVDTIPSGAFTVLAQFVIDEKGKLGEVSILKDPGYGLGKRVLHVLSGYKGHWKPAIQNNKLVRSIRRQPITFVIEEDECEDEVPAGLIL